MCGINSRWPGQSQIGGKKASVSWALVADNSLANLQVLRLSTHILLGKHNVFLGLTGMESFRGTLHTHVFFLEIVLPENTSLLPHLSFHF